MTQETPETIIANIEAKFAELKARTDEVEKRATEVTFAYLATRRELQATKRELVRIGLQYAGERVHSVQAEYKHAKDLADFSIEEIEAEDAEIDKLVAEAIAAAAKK